MNCPSVLTGKEFLADTLNHIDCQAQTLGSYGYLVLSQPGSMASLLLGGLLTLFIGLFGVRLLFGSPPNSGDAVKDVLKVAIVLTLALSWPAWRTLVYNVTLKAPAEIAASIAPASLPYGASGGFADRLQNVDTGLITLTVRGTGRNIGALTKETAPPAGFRGVALEDESGFASARLIFLASTIGALAVVRLGAGLLLAVTPLAAGLLLFEASRGLFSGWLRGLLLTMIASIGITIVLAAELALLEPWLQDALRLRDLGYATPAAPTELLALTAGFALALFGMIILLGKVAFQRGWSARFAISPAIPSMGRTESRIDQGSYAGLPAGSTPSRALMLSERVSTTMRREEHARLASSTLDQRFAMVPTADLPGGTAITTTAPGARRSNPRVSPAAARRDGHT